MSSRASTDLELLNLTGNDIVDLTLPEILGKAFEFRYINHICTEEEYNFLLSAPNRHSTMWAIWAAKEAAFKVIKKNYLKLGFSPRKFIVECLPLNDFEENNIISSRVNYEHHFIAVRWFITSEYVHCIAVWSDRKYVWDNLRSEIWNTDDKNLLFTTQNFSNHEMLSIGSRESYLVRMLTKQLLSDNGVKNVEIIRDLINNRLGPPYVLQNEMRCEKYDISMSHHGRYVAACLLL